MQKMLTSVDATAGPPVVTPVAGAPVSTIVRAAAMFVKASDARWPHFVNPGADGESRRRRALVTGRVVAVRVDRLRRTGETVVRAAVARVGARVADRTHLDEGLAGAARAVRVRDAAFAHVRTAHAGTGFTGS